MTMRVEPLAVADPLSLPNLERELGKDWFVWDAWTNGKRRVDLHPLVLSEGTHREAMAVAEEAWRLVADAGDDPAPYGLHEDVERLAQAARRAGDRSVVARVDLLLRDDGKLVACEVNADCPGGHNEALALPRLAYRAGLRRLENPTNVVERLADLLVARAEGGLIGLCYATAYSEDLQVCAIVERLVRERGGKTMRISPTMLKADGEGVAVRGQRIAVLYKFYPLEWMEGQRNIDALARATETGALSSCSSFAAIHAQSKLAMARAAANDVFPETVAYEDVRTRLRGERDAWVVKRDLSRVGDHVYVGSLMSDEDFSATLDEVDLVVEDGQRWIAQRFVPQLPLATPWGKQLVTLGVYLVDGSFAGYYARLSPTSHCSHDALALPVFVA